MEVVLAVLKLLSTTFNVRTSMFKWVPCHHGVVRPRAVDGEDAPQIWNVAENMSSSQLRAATWGSSPVSGLGWGVTTALVHYEILKRASDLGGFFGTT
jgi:hypothetical protein